MKDSLSVVAKSPKHSSRTDHLLKKSAFSSRMPPRLLARSTAGCDYLRVVPSETPA